MSNTPGTNKTSNLSKIARDTGTQTNTPNNKPLNNVGKAETHQEILNESVVIHSLDNTQFLDLVDQMNMLLEGE